MSIKVNGNEHPLPNETTIQGLLSDLGLGDKPVVVEHNKIAIFPRDYMTTQLSSGDSIEIITIAAGG
ncbi:sulfur carrier protein ThiS [Rubritalea spongiae]|uniref:Sulfur carrier protein ThiS n=1 Tax=Rubritalea spongiae TaxID=430797 RepID=A0ABW5E4P9_9BACT